MSKHDEALNKIHKSLYTLIDKITEDQQVSGDMDQRNCFTLIEVAKFLRTDKTVDDSNIDYSKLSMEEIDAEIAKAVSDNDSKKAKK